MCTSNPITSAVCVAKCPRCVWWNSRRPCFRFPSLAVERMQKGCRFPFRFTFPLAEDDDLPATFPRVVLRRVAFLLFSGGISSPESLPSGSFRCPAGFFLKHVYRQVLRPANALLLSLDCELISAFIVPRDHRTKFVLLGPRLFLVIVFFSSVSSQIKKGGGYISAR